MDGLYRHIQNFVFSISSEDGHLTPRKNEKYWYVSQVNDLNSYLYISHFPSRYNSKLKYSNLKSINNKITLETSYLTKSMLFGEMIVNRKYTCNSSTFIMIQEILFLP